MIPPGFSQVDAPVYDPANEDPSLCPFKVANPPRPTEGASEFASVLWEHNIARFVYTLGVTCAPDSSSLWALLWPAGRYKPPSKPLGLHLFAYQRGCGARCGCSLLGSDCLEIGEKCSSSSANCGENADCCNSDCAAAIGCRKPNSTAARFCIPKDSSEWSPYCYGSTW